MHALEEARRAGFLAMQFNYLMDKGAFVPHGDGTFSVDENKAKNAVRELDHDLLTIEAEGDYAAAKKMLDELGVVRPILKRALARRLTDHTRLVAQVCSIIILHVVT